MYRLTSVTYQCHSWSGKYRSSLYHRARHARSYAIHPCIFPLEVILCQIIPHAESSLPGAVVIFGVALGIRNAQAQLPNLVYPLLSGLNAATVGLIALAAVRLSERAITNKMERLIISATGCVGILYQSGSTLISSNS